MLTTLQGDTIKVVEYVEEDDDEGNSGRFNVVLLANDDAGIQRYNLTFNGKNIII